MPTRDENLATVSRIRAELTALLDGMDYCLDWKDGDGWCAREILYHLVDTPEGGVGSSIAGVLDGSRTEITILPDINNMNPERMAAEPAEALAGVLAILQTAEEAIAAAAADDFEQRTTLAHPAGPRHRRNPHRPVIGRRDPRPPLGRAPGTTARNTRRFGDVGPLWSREERPLPPSLRGAQRRGNLVEVEHTSANHHCYGDEIATSLRSSQ